MELVNLGMRASGQTAGPSGITYQVSNAADERTVGLALGLIPGGSDAERRAAKHTFCGRYGRMPVDPWVAHRQQVGHAGVEPAVPGAAPAAAPAPTSGGRVDYGAAGAPRVPAAPQALSEAEAFRASIWGLSRVRRGLRGALSFGGRK